MTKDLRTAAYDLALAAGALVVASDEMDELRAERVEVLNRLKDVQAALASQEA